MGADGKSEVAYVLGGWQGSVQVAQQGPLRLAGLPGLRTIAFRPAPNSPRLNVGAFCVASV